MLQVQRNVMLLLKPQIVLIADTLMGLLSLKAKEEKGSDLL